MIVRPPLPDEPLTAFIGRMKRNNLCSSNDELFRKLSEYISPKNTENIANDPVGLLAEVYGMKPIFFVRQHTMLPISKLVVWFDRTNEKEVNLEHPRYAKLALRNFQNIASLCRECVAEDINFRGFAYWRRVHQLPGVDRCTKHGTTLISYSGRDVLERSPLYCLSVLNQVVNEPLDEICSNEFVARYIQIAVNLITEISKPIHIEDISVHIREWAKNQNLRVSLNGKRPLLSDRAVEMLPRAWLKKHFPRSETKEYGGFSDWIDGTWFSRKTPRNPAAYILALSIMYESADEAINALANLKPAIVPRKVLIHRKKGAWDSAEFIKVWMLHLGNTAAISEELNLSKAYIYQRIVAAGLPCLSKKAGAALKLAVQRYWQGESISAACKFSGAIIEDVEKFLRVATYRSISEFWETGYDNDCDISGIINGLKFN